MVLVFDLDDTLYDEITYVKSGFKAVAAFLHEQFSVDEKKLVQELMKELENGRGSIFDTVLKKHSLFTKKRVKQCITVYRLHKPDIQLSTSGKKCLERFKKYPLYIVTDGNKIVQYNKIKALKVDKMVKQYFITHRYGVHNAKPSAYCFLKICEPEKADPEQVVYIADNINKDFVGIKSLGFKTIQVLTGQYTALKKEKKYHAALKINSLDELTEKLIATL
jgi:putative hydrolase of the HAD superfamily